MRCDQCNYPLWNLKTRECPECGRAFKPSDHTFVPNSVRFCCRECDQPYYGSGPGGHLVPTSFACVKCGAAQTMDEMVLRPTAGIEEEETRVDSMPWLDRKRVGRWRAWLRTLGRSMIAPAALIRTVPPERAHGQAWWYATVTIALIMACGAGVPFLGIVLVDLIGGGNDALDILLVGAAFVAGGGAALLVLAVLWGLVTHAVLRLSGGAAFGLGRTWQAVCYSVGAAVTMAFPCLGVYPFAFIGLGWWLVSAILMVTFGQRVHPGRAVFAVMVFPVIVGAAVTAGGAGLAMYGLAQAKLMATQAGAGVSSEAECTLMLDALIAHHDLDGDWPAHAFAMVAGDRVTADDFTAGGSGTHEESIPLADTTLDIAASMTPGARREVIDALVAAQPPDVLAHRVGDFVFTYHGVARTEADKKLWLVIMSPDPVASGPRSIDGVLVVGVADGSTDSIPEDEFAAALAGQNDLRATRGLAPLPDPAQVRHR